MNRRQRLLRLLFRVVGPAQVGLPPYATDEERERYARDRLGPPPAPQRPTLPGYRMVSYVDEHGVTHRSAVPDDPQDPQDPQDRAG